MGEGKQPRFVQAFGAWGAERACFAITFRPGEIKPSGSDLQQRALGGEVTCQNPEPSFRAEASDLVASPGHNGRGRIVSSHVSNALTPMIADELRK